MKAESLRVLFISAVPTDPPDAGNRVRIMTLTRSLIAAGHEVHFAYFPMESCDLPAMQARFGADRLHVLHSAPAAPDGWLAFPCGTKAGRLMNIEQAFVWGLDDWYDERANSELAALHSLHQYDAVFVEYVFASKALEAFPPDCLRVLDTHDCFGLRHRLYLKAGMRPQWFSTSVADEDCGFRRADIVLAIQASESRDFKARVEGSGTRVLQVGHLIDIADAAPPSRREAAVFLGSANPINVAGARYFIDRVLPIVRRTKPGFQLLLAGAVSAEFENQDGVVKLGFVPNLQDAFGAAMIAVNPVLVGTGVNIKLLDAMASAMPIVTTRSGHEASRNSMAMRSSLSTMKDPGAFCRSNPRTDRRRRCASPDLPPARVLPQNSGTRSRSARWWAPWSGNRPDAPHMTQPSLRRHGSPSIPSTWEGRDAEPGTSAAGNRLQALVGRG